MLGLSVEDRFHSELLSLPKNQQRKVLKAVADLRRDPSHLSKPLEGLPGVWRRRVDPYRVLFTMAPGWLHVYSVQQREGVYQGHIATPKAVPTEPLTLPKLSPETLASAAVAAEKGVAAGVGDHCWEIVWKIVDCRSEEDLLGLIDTGVPDGIVDRLELDLKSREYDSRPTTLVQLVRQNVLDAFFGRLLLLGESQAPQELLIAAPWLTSWSGPKSSFDGLLRFLARRRVRATILTRPPDMPSHKAALAQLREIASVQVIHVPGLHAKFFVCDVAPVPFALLASANTTAKSYSNWEVGVLVRGSGEAETFVRDLQALAIDLIAAGKLNKRRSMR